LSFNLDICGIKFILKSKKSLRYFNLHTHRPTDATDVLEIVNRHQKEMELPFLTHKTYSTGLHPWFLDEKSKKEDLAWLQTVAHLPNVQYIGECGLDRLINVPMAYQEHIFLQHIAISESLKKPIILHCVRAHERILQLRKQLKPNQPWTFHGFDKNLATALKCIEAGCYLSFGSAMLRNEERFATILNGIPREKIYFETDISEIRIEEVYACGERIFSKKQTVER
jgi:TatD DNase family protein